MPQLELQSVPNNEREMKSRSPGIAGGEYRFAGTPPQGPANGRAGPGLRLTIPSPAQSSASSRGRRGHRAGHPSQASTPSNSQPRRAEKSINIPHESPSYPAAGRYRPVLDNLAYREQEGRGDGHPQSSLSPASLRRELPSPYMNKLGLMTTTPVDGCLILGKYPRGPSFMNYFTRYWVNRKEQRSALAWRSLTDEFIPCCGSENWSSYTKATWSFFRSDAFLLFLRVVVLILGVTKETLDYRHSRSLQYGEALYLLHSVVEIILTTLQLFLTTMSVWTNFMSIKSQVRNQECVTREVSARGRIMRFGVGMLIFFSLLVIGANMACFIILYMYVHLGWTILTNSAAMMIFQSIASVFNARIALVKRVMVRDQHKLALYESVLLLRESFVLQGRDKHDYYERVDKFLHCFSHTPMFDKPRHVHLLSEHVIDWDSYLPQEHITIL